MPNGDRAANVTGDSEILAACDELHAFTGQSVFVVTGDVTMSLRAANAGFDSRLLDHGIAE